MRRIISKLGKPNPNARRAMARPLFCQTCAETKAAKEFRQTNRDSRLNIVCWQCRHDNRRAESDLWRTPTRRRDSIFRRKFWAINALLKTKKTKKEVKNLKTNELKNQSAKYLRLPERVAAIVGKTYAVRGDDFKLGDDEALTRIRDLLDELDATLIARNKNKRLSR